MLGQVLASIAFGLVKGFAAPRAAQSSSLQQNFLGPLREEAVYRAAPFAAFGSSIPTGATAAMFAADHLVSDLKQTPTMTGTQMLGRLGDVLLGGYLYEGAYRSAGIVGAVAAHGLHNAAVSFGQRLRNKK